jgi:hypothetical protein
MYIHNENPVLFICWLGDFYSNCILDVFAKSDYEDPIEQKFLLRSK